MSDYEKERDKAADFHNRECGITSGTDTDMLLLTGFVAGADWGRKYGNAEILNSDEISQMAISLEHMTEWCRTEFDDIEGLRSYAQKNYHCLVKIRAAFDALLGGK